LFPGAACQHVFRWLRIYFLCSFGRVSQHAKAAPLQSAVIQNSAARGAVVSYSPDVLSTPEFYASVLAVVACGGAAPSLFLQFAGFWRQLLFAPIIRPTGGQRWFGFDAVSENR
jgi:hypothetical protein